MKKVFITSLLMLMMISFVISGCSGNNEADQNVNGEQGELVSVKVMLDWVPNTNHTGIYAAKVKGWYKEQGLDVEIVRPPEGGTAQLIAAGQGDFGISYQEEVTYARANDVPVVSVAAIIQHNTSGFASPKGKNIISPKDFEGKKYGGWGSPVESAIIDSLMKKENADVSKVEFVNMGTSDFFTVTSNDRVDFAWIYYGWTGIEAELKEYPINFIKLTDSAPELDFYTPVIIVNEDYIKENPETIKKFLAATTKGYEYAISNPKEAAESLLSQEQGLNSDLVYKSQEWLSSKYQDDAKQWGIQKNEVWDNYAKWMFDHQLIPKMIDADKAFTNEFLPR